MFALITGAVAMMAVVPQTVLPIDIKYAILVGIFSFFIRILITTKTLIIHITINGIAILPKSKNSNGLSWIPRQIIPSFKIYSLVKSKPFCKLSRTLKAFQKKYPIELQS